MPADGTMPWPRSKLGLAIINDTGNLNFVLYYDAVLAKIAIHRGDLARRKRS